MAILSSPSPIRRAPDSHERNPISASKTPHCAKCDQRTLFANEVMRCCTCVELLTKHSSRTSSKRRGPAVDRLSQQMHGNGWASGRMRPAMPVLWGFFSELSKTRVNISVVQNLLTLMSTCRDEINRQPLKRVIQSSKTFRHIAR